MTFDVTAARKAGYSESEILTHLAGTTKFDLDSARKAGYSDAELLKHMSGMKITKAPAPAVPLPVGVDNPVISPVAAPEVVPAAYVEDQGPSLADKLIGAGEAGLTLATGATGGTLGLLGGFLGGVPAAIATGEIGSQEGVRNVEEAAFQGMSGLTYQPRTQMGQEYAGNVGEVMMQAVPALPLTAEMNAIGRIAANAGRAGRVVGSAAAQAATDRMRAAAPNVAARVDRVMRRNPAPDAAPVAVPAAAAMTPEQIARLAQLDEQVAGAPSRPITAADGTPLELPGRAPRRLNEAEAAEQAALQAQRAAQEAADAAPAVPPADTATPTPGTLGSAGAAGTDMLAQRRELAAKVGIEPTFGQLTRDPQNLRFEAEMAKGPQGGKLVERYSQQNAQMMQHFDNLVDMTGAEAADLAGVGRAVDSVLRKELARDKNEVRVAYQKADKSPEAAAPVVLEDAVQFLNESAPDQAVSPLLVAARSRALKLGVAKEGADGELVAIPTTVKNAELFRRAVGSATDFEPTNIRNSAIIKGAVDTATEAIAGPMYRSARRLRENLGNKYENRGMVADLLNNKRGMKDRKVAVEDVFKRTILNGTREELSHLRSVLQAGGDTGKQAWKELQGATVNWIKDEAFTNTASDATGKTILSVPKLASAVKKLEQGGKLKFILGGEQGAQHMRDLVDLSKVIYTAPPGVINHSNTASVLLAALTEAGAVGTMTGLPVPVLSALRALSVHAKNRAIQKRIDAALAGRDYKAPKNPPAF